MSEYHNPVLLQESVNSLITNIDGVYADATFGGGGHSREILNRLSDKGRLMSFDRDADAIRNIEIATASPHNDETDQLKSVIANDSEAIPELRFRFIHNNFRFIHNYTLLYEKQGLDGILADLGVSSHQFDTGSRGFSFRYSAPLDMRMNVQGGKTAADIVNSYTQEELERILKLYGELENAKRLSQLIVAARAKAPLLTTDELDNALAPALPSFADHKVLAKIYQAFRIEVNDEMRSLEKFLQGALESLKPGGRLVIITYHSLEDRMVKNFMRSCNIDGIDKKDNFGRSLSQLKVLTRKPILPSEEEISSNTRARSAKLRIAEKL